MSHKLFTWTLGLLIATPALAHTGSEHINLPSCGGHAVVYRNERQTIIKIEDVRECSNITVNGQRFKMQSHHGELYSYVYTWQPTIYRDQLTLRVHSNSSRTEDYVHLRADEKYSGRKRPHWERPVTWKPHHAPVVTVRENDLIYLDESRNSAHLPACGGRLRVELDHQRLVVRVEGRNTCDQVRLTVFNQQPLVMESVRRFDRGYQTWTFRLPERSVRPGRNSLTLAVQNSRRDRADYVRYYFSDQRWFFASGGR